MAVAKINRSRPVAAYGGGFGRRLGIQDLLDDSAAKAGCMAAWRNVERR